MAANTEPIFALTPKNSTTQISTANTNRDGTGTIGTVYTAGTNGSRIDVITVKATVTTTAGMIRLFIDDGSNVRLWKEVEVSAITPSATVQTFVSIVEQDNDDDMPLILQATWELQASTHNAETFNIIVQAGDF